MAKYKGKNKGQPRGKYKIEMYEIKGIPYSKDPHDGLAIHLNEYLCDSGKCLDSFIETRIEHRFYHFAGATVWLKESSEPKSRTHDVRLIFVSNDQLDDVVSKILKKFPDFKQVPISLTELSYII